MAHHLCFSHRQFFALVYLLQVLKFWMGFFPLEIPVYGVILQETQLPVFFSENKLQVLMAARRHLERLI